MDIKLKINTWIDFPFIAKTTSPGFVALPLGKFSVSGINPNEWKKHLYYFLLDEKKLKVGWKNFN